MFDVRRHNFAVQAVANSRETGFAQRLHLNHRIEFVRPAAPVLFGHGHAQEAVLSRLVPNSPVDIPLVFPLRVKWGDLFVNKAGKAIAKRFVVSGEKCAFNHGENSLEG